MKHEYVSLELTVHSAIEFYLIIRTSDNEFFTNKK